MHTIAKDRSKRITRKQEKIISQYYLVFSSVSVDSNALNEFAWKCDPNNNFILGQKGSVKIHLTNGKAIKAIKSMKRTICQFRVTLKETIMIYLRITNCKDEHYLKVNNTETSRPIGEEILIPSLSLLTLGLTVYMM